MVKTKRVLTDLFSAKRSNDCMVKKIPNKKFITQEPIKKRRQEAIFWTVDNLTKSIALS